MGEQMYRIAWKHVSGASGVNDIDHTKEDVDSILPVLRIAPNGGFTYWAVPVENEAASPFVRKWNASEKALEAGELGELTALAAMRRSTYQDLSEYAAADAETSVEQENTNATKG